MELLNRACLFVLPLFVLLQIACKQQPREPYQLEQQPRPLISASNTRVPKLEVSSSGMISLLLAYREGETTHLGFSMSHDGGDNFTPLIPVSADSKNVTAHGEASPMLATAPTAIYALWEQQQEVMFSRSMNYGGSFDPPVRIAGGDGAFHGFASLAAAPDGNPFAVWLDGRNQNDAPGTFSLYFSRSTDRGTTFSEHNRIAGSACPCCRPSLAFGSRSKVFVGWRKVFPNDVRDMAVSTSHDNGASFSEEVRVAEDGWSLRGCPDSGPALAVVQDRLYIAWLTEGRNRHSRIQLSWSDDDARHFHEPIVVSGGVLDPNHPRIARSEEGNLVLVFQGRSTAQSDAWTPSGIFLVQVQGDRVTAPQPLPHGNISASYPTAAAGTGGRLFIAWTEQANNGPRAVLLRARQAF